MKRAVDLDQTEMGGYMLLVQKARPRRGGNGSKNGGGWHSGAGWHSLFFS